MKEIDTFPDLYQHQNWADGELWRAVFACEPARQDTRVREVFFHIHLGQRGYRSLTLDLPIELPRSADDFEDLAAIAKWGYTYHQEVPSMLAGLTDEGLERQVEVPWAEWFKKQLGGPPKRNATLREIMRQVPAHSAYHRGQVNARLRELGGEPALVDYIAWIWGDRPQPSWPESATR